MSMKHLLASMLTMALMVLFIPLDDVLAKGKGFCRHSAKGSGSRLTPGRIKRSDFKEFFVISYAVQQEYGGDVQMFTSQMHDGYYLKVCNIDEQKNDFKNWARRRYGINVIASTCKTVCLDPETFYSNYYDQKGVYSYRRLTRLYKQTCW
uniref:Uncharacterized protein n=1 Tax=Candidatus Kentrum sp. FW TaxID=2126338 RepID=A0A450TW63_9GAMM|nr:MAG: hypothetical protein BECKFW1821C_GA0114237_104729 [Candidatus Kentron sp. FW]